MKLKFPKNSIFLFIVVIAIALRFVVIDKVPPSLNWDEISHGYNAFSILKSGQDEWGEILPNIFRAYGDYKLPVYIYLTSLTEAIFGLTPFAVRLPSLLAGIATVIFTYFLTRKLFNEKVALISSLLVAVEPWSFFLSRGAFEANLALALIVSGVYFFIEGLKRAKFLFLSTVLFGLSVWTYNSARVFTPLLITSVVVIYFKEVSSLWKEKRISVVSSFLMVLLFMAPMFYQLANPVGIARYGKVSIIDEGAIAQINEKRAVANCSSFVERLFYNKGTYFAQAFVKNYFSHFSFNFLAFKGGSHYQFSVPGRGLIYPINMVFFVLGLFFLVKKRSRESIFILSWLLLSPIPSSLTREAPHVLRAITMLPTPMIVSSLGFFFLLDFLKKRKINTRLAVPLYLIILFFLMEAYLSAYFENYKKDYSWSWQYGYQEAITYVKENYDNYDKIIFSKKYGEPHEFLLFYWPWNPEKYRTDTKLIRFEQSGWFWVDAFDKFYFINDWEIPKEGKIFTLESKKERVDCTKSRCLLITSPGNFPKGWQNLKTMDFLNGTPAFEIYEN